jgi:hypothetical protein
MQHVVVGPVYAAGGSAAAKQRKQQSRSLHPAVALCSAMQAAGSAMQQKNHFKKIYIEDFSWPLKLPCSTEPFLHPSLEFKCIPQ